MRNHKSRWRARKTWREYSIACIWPYSTKRKAKQVASRTTHIMTLVKFEPDNEQAKKVFVYVNHLASM